MGLKDKLFKKESERQVGSKFDKNEANEIFDALDKLDLKESAKPKKQIENVKEASNLLKEAKSLGNCDEAIEIYKKVIAMMPENGEAYEALAEIYHENNDTASEIDILKSGIKNIENNNIKNNLVERLKKIN